MKDMNLLQHFSKQLGVTIESFSMKEHKYTYSNKGFMMLTMGNNCIFKGKKELLDWCKGKFDNVPAEEIMDGSNLFDLESKLREEGYKLEGQHLVFEHVKDVSLSLPEGYKTNVMTQPKIKEYYQYKEFDNAFSFNEKEDCLAIALFHEEKVVAMVACDNRVPSSWQIGIDTLKEHRGKGIASYLVSEIAKEIKKNGVTPFYTTWGANIASLRVALKAGFTPAATYYYGKKEKK